MIQPAPSALFRLSSAINGFVEILGPLVPILQAGKGCSKSIQSDSTLTVLGGGPRDTISSFGNGFLFVFRSTRCLIAGLQGNGQIG